MHRHRKLTYSTRAALRCGSLALVAAMALPSVHGQNWTDRSEYDLVLAIRAEAVPAKRLELIEQWNQKFPKTELRPIRAELTLAAHESLGNIPKMLATAREIVANDRRSMVGLYWMTVLTPGSADLTPELLSQAEKAARQLITESPDFFSPDRRPKGSQGAEWEKQRMQVEVIAHRTIGWIQWQRGSYDAAETEFRAALQINPKQTEISSWLGTVLAIQKAPEKQLQAIWHLSRAAYLDSEALSPAQQGEVRTMLERVYSVYHGEVEGMDKIGTAAAASLMPPADFQIETAEQVRLRKYDEELGRTNPQLLAWIKIRRQLEDVNAQRNFQTLSGSAMPLLKGFVVRHSPEKKPTEIVLALQDPTVEEITLKLNAPLPGSAEPGTAIEFEAVPVSFTARPFMLMVQGEREKVTGWPVAGK